MTTFLILKDRIASELRGVAQSKATRIPNQISAAVLTAIKHYERRRFYFNMKTNTFATVASQEYYAAAALADIPNIVQIDSMRLTGAGGAFSIIQEQPFTDIDGQQGGSGATPDTGDPTKFAYYAQQIRLYPIPAAIRTVTLAYVYRLVTLSADGDSNVWTLDGEELIRQAAKRIVAIDVLGDDAMAARFGAREQEVLAALLAETFTRAPQARGPQKPVMPMQPLPQAGA